MSSTRNRWDSKENKLTRNKKLASCLCRYRSWVTAEQVVGDAPSLTQSVSGCEKGSMIKLPLIMEP